MCRSVQVKSETMMQTKAENLKKGFSINILTLITITKNSTVLLQYFDFFKVYIIYDNSLSLSNTGTPVLVLTVALFGNPSTLISFSRLHIFCKVTQQIFFS